jgi:hypothetical protein
MAALDRGKYLGARSSCAGVRQAGLRVIRCAL